MNEPISGLSISVALLSSLLVKLWVGTWVALALLDLGFPIFEMDRVMGAALPAPALAVACWTGSGHSQVQVSTDTAHTQLLMNLNNFWGGSNARR